MSARDEAARDKLVDFLVQYGGNCRDCADEDGFCPQTGIGCGQRRKAVEFVLGALEYGSKHGFAAGFSIVHKDEIHAPSVERAIAVALAHIQQPGMTDNPAYVHFEPADAMAKKIAAALRELMKEVG